jgi:putative oxidoreductase
MLRSILQTSAGAAPLVARVVLGIVMFPHGAQHMLGWFGGYGFKGTLGWMTGPLGFPAPLAATAIATEMVAPFLLIAGLGGRLAALGIVTLMATAASTHVANGFFMNWVGSLPAGTEGFEYHLLAIATAAIVLIQGSGAASLDGWLARREPRGGR